MIYNCEFCNYSTKIKTHFNRHLNTRKHKINIYKYGDICKNGVKSSNFTHNLTTKNTKNIPKFDHFFLKENDIEKNSDYKQNNKKFKCLFCEKSFSRIDSLNRHIKNSCKVKRKYDLNLSMVQGKTTLDMVKNVDNKIINNNTNINNGTVNTDNSQNYTNNITVNNFGEENMEMITKSFLKKSIIYPLRGLTKMIEKIHFNEKYPENKNVRMLNKKDNKLQIIDKGKWKYVDKDETIRRLVDEKNSSMGDFYEEHKQIFTRGIL